MSFAEEITGIPSGTERVVFTRRPMGDDCRNNPDATEYAVTPGGVEFESEAEAMYWMTVGCNCGRPHEVGRFLVECMQCFSESGGFKKKMPGVEGVKKLVTSNPEAAAEFIAHILSDRGLLEYGGSVYGSWRTPRGEQFLETVGDAA